jgi:hypothetical protein
MLKILTIILILSNVALCFLPQILEDDLNIVNKLINLNQISDSISHEEILRRGLIHSVAKYFFEKSSSQITKKIDMIKLNRTQYYNSNDLFKDYYGVDGKAVCIKFEILLKTEFLPNVIIVDFDPNTRDLPYAHCDGETLLKTNERILKMKQQIYDSLSAKHYSKARKLTAQVLHTIHDFYSHSNWIEIGMKDINFNLEIPNLNNQSVIKQTDSNACINNCSLVTEKCNFSLDIFVRFLQKLGFDSPIIKCPITYYICHDNIFIKDRLLSGYADKQKLEDGSPYEKPVGLMKCSHGGIMDSSSLIDAIGGINKDSGFYIFSPHAHLHLDAADLAIKHTTYFFDQLRAKIGDDEFEKFLHLDNNNNPILKFLSSLFSFDFCSSSSNSCLINWFNFITPLFFNYLVNYIL